MLKKLHLIVGILGLLAFLGTGLMMHFGYDHLRGMTDARRLLFRSTHIYLLFGAMINLGLGMYLSPLSGWCRWIQTLGSVLVMSTPVFALLGFFTEPWLTELQRPYSFATAFSCLVGMMLHLITWISTRMFANRK